MGAQQWYAVKTKPRRELLARASLEQRGIDVFLPHVPVRRSRNGAGPLEPLFPGYLFSRLAVGTDEWLAARSAPNVAYFLGAGHTPSPLSEDLIEGIRVRAERCQRSGWDPPFRQGEAVVIQGGPFSGLEALFDSALSPSGRVRVLLELVNRLVPVEIDAGLLRQARRERPAAGA